METSICCVQNKMIGMMVRIMDLFQRKVRTFDKLVKINILLTSQLVFSMKSSSCSCLSVFAEDIVPTLKNKVTLMRFTLT